MFDLKKHLIVLHLCGSKAYGLDTPKSDTDIGGIVIPPIEYFFGICNNFEQTTEINSLVEIFKNNLDTSKKIEGTIYGLRKFLQLCSDCNPNIIERLFLDDKDYIYKNAFFQKILDNRNLFLSKKARFTFSGYAVAQVKKIDRHRRWFTNPYTKKPERSDFDLPEIRTSQYDAAEALINNEIEHWAYHDLDISPEIADAVKSKTKEQLAYTLASLNLPNIDIFDESSIRNAAMKKIGFDDNLLAVLEKEHKYRNELKNYHHYLEWQKNRNPERAEMEKKFGLDCKNASHVVRLLKMGDEILSTGKIIVKRTEDREELLSIKNGAWSYEQLMEYAQKMQIRLEELYKTSTLQKSPDIKKIDALCIDLVEEALRTK